MEKSNDFTNSHDKESEVAHNETNSSTADGVNRRQTKICVYYSNYEFCRFGNNCKFLHRRGNSQRKFVSKQFATSRMEMERNQNKNISSSLSVKKKFPISREQNLSNLQNTKDYKKSCRYFKAGNCDKGDKCLFSHSFSNNASMFASSGAIQSTTRNIPRTPDAKKNSIPVCQYFKRGFCNNGNRCKFYHPQKYLTSAKVGTFSTSHKNQISQSKEINNKAIVCSNPSGSEKNCVENEDNKINCKTTVVAPKNICDSNCESRDQNDIGKMCEQADASLICNQIHLNFVDSMDSKTNEEFISDQKQLSENKCTEDLLQNNDIFVNLTDNAKASKDLRMPLSANKVFSLSSPEIEINQLRFTEISQFMKRFPSFEVIEENQSFSFTFQPSDPDWPFDLKMIKLQVTFPEMYPKEICNINVIRSADYIPETLFRHLNQSISDWLNDRHKASIESEQVELIFRPFLKWFDKNLEDIFNCGLKREKQDINNIEDNLQLLTVECTAQDPNLSTIEERNLEETTEISAEAEKHITQEMSQVSISRQKNVSGSSICTSQNQGVKILFIGLEFIEGVAALTCTKVAAMLQCIRCKTSHNIKSPPNKNNSVTCSKCSKRMESNFNPSLLHQFSNVLGTMHLVECQVVDINLVESAFLIDCLNCSKQVGVNGIHYGQKQKLWCMFCNQKLVISIGSVKFQASAPTYAATKVADKAVKKAEKKKDPLIKEGSPLPQFGACKHYKKSNRWLRFPCCGRVYPCDVCHEEKEIDHEMKFASRMICGFCSKEQPYSKEKPCISCTSGMVAKSGAHWEGGKGCRNKVKMARDDKHKYAGTSKTVSKKAQNSGNKKK